MRIATRPSLIPVSKYLEFLQPSISRGTDSSLQSVQRSVARLGCLLVQASPCSSTAKALSSEYNALVNQALLPKPEANEGEEPPEEEGTPPESDDQSLMGAVVPAALLARTEAFLRSQQLVVGDPELSRCAEGEYPSVLYDPAVGWLIDTTQPLPAQILTVIAACLDQYSNRWADRISQFQAQLQTLQQQYMLHMSLLSTVQSMDYDLAQWVVQRVI